MSEITNTFSNKPYILGLDLGANSVGWAAVALTDGKPTGILGLGSRIFSAGVESLETGKDTPKNLERRMARQQRRQAARRARRQRRVYRLLLSWQLLPALPPDAADERAARHEAICQLDRELKTLPSLDDGKSHLDQRLPYRLRALALQEALAPFALGRVFFHLAQRRGFRASRRADAREDEKRLSEFKSRLSQLQQEISESGAETIGEYFSRCDLDVARIRTRPTLRTLFHEEFDKIWESQARFHPTVLTPDRKKRLWHAIFFQRPLKSSARLVGKCELEPGFRKAAKADPLFQRFRILQAVNNLELILPDKTVRPLTSDERTTVLAELEANESVKFTTLRARIKAPKGSRLNFEDGERKSLEGNRTESKLRAVFGDRWASLPPPDRSLIIGQLRTIDDPNLLYSLAVRQWGLAPDEARAFADVHIEPGYAALSRRAIRKLLPYMEEGESFAAARRKLYGEDHHSKAVSTLPPVSELGLIRNPAVLRTLTEMRKVVNNAIRTWGRPLEVHVELARELKKSADERKRIYRENEQRRSDREAVAARIAQIKPRPTGEDIEKWRLAEECQWHCPYSGRQINEHALLETGEFQIEHIVPFSRSYDDSYLNKTLCHRDWNILKGNRTPIEAFGQTPEWDEILHRVRNFNGYPRSNPKLTRFQMQGEELGEEFTSRMLNDTRYASRLAGIYLSRLYGGLSDEQYGRRVHTVTGQLTAFLRNAWLLNSLLTDPAKQEERSVGKTRDDHRHHALDALVVALTTPARLQALSAEASATPHIRARRLKPRAPWPGFVDSIRPILESAVVSHRPVRTARGNIHDATIYSPPQVGGATGAGPTRVHVRKELAKLSRDNVSNIVDDAVRAAVEARLVDLGAKDPKLAFATPETHPYLLSRDGRRIPIHKVRIWLKKTVTPLGTGVRLRHVASAENHHVAFYESKDKRGRPGLRAEVVPLLEALQRKKQGLPLVRQTDEHGAPLRIVLFKGDTIEVNPPDRAKEYWVVDSFSPTGTGGVDMEFTLHSDARTKADRKRVEGARLRETSPKFLLTHKVRLVEVDPLGRVFPRSC